jgi:hypothetical protein
MALQAKTETLPGRFEDTNAFGNHFFPDAVSGDYRDVESLHQLLFVLVTQKAVVTALTCLGQSPVIL